MSIKNKLLLSAFGVTAVALITWLFFFSLHRPESFVRASLLKRTPLGSTSQEVRAFVEGRGWLDRNYIGSTGFLKTEIGVPASQEHAVGVTSIRGELGHYRSGLFQTYVSAFWGSIPTTI